MAVNRRLAEYQRFRESDRQDTSDTKRGRPRKESDTNSDTLRFVSDYVSELVSDFHHDCDTSTTLDTSDT